MAMMYICLDSYTNKSTCRFDISVGMAFYVKHVIYLYVVVNYFNRYLSKPGKIQVITEPHKTVSL